MTATPKATTVQFYWTGTHHSNCRAKRLLYRYLVVLCEAQSVAVLKLNILHRVFLGVLLTSGLSVGVVLQTRRHWQVIRNPDNTQTSQKTYKHAKDECFKLSLIHVALFAKQRTGTSDNHFQRVTLTKKAINSFIR